MINRLQIDRVCYLLFLGIVVSIFSFSQTVIVLDSAQIPGTTVVIAGNKYDRSGMHKMWMGKHYRAEWLTPVRVPNLMLDTAFGGLTLVKESGGRQTQGLRLKNSKGKEYVLRSIDKDFAQGLGDRFKGTFIARTAKDQSSIGHPYAAPSIAALIRPTGIFHTNPRIVFVPTQQRLGEFNEKYGNQLYLIEERPDENQEDAPNFGRAKNVIGTEKLREHIYNHTDRRVDQVAYARARLFDMLIGDWSRHADQWRWAEFESTGKTIFKPVPRDRDQAFSRFDGVLPWFATAVFGATFLESFDDDVTNVEDFNRPARPLDRQFLNELTRQQWIDVATELKSVLTDSLIEASIRLMPQNIFKISGETIIHGIKGRRDNLEKTAVDYYEYLAKHVDVLGSNQSEVVEVDRINETQTAIRVYKMEDGTSVKQDPFYSRVFDKDETKEVRLYTLESADVIRFKGAARNGITVRIIDPAGTDSIGHKKDRYTRISSGPRFEYDTLPEKKFDFFFWPFLSPPECEVFDADPMQLFTRPGVKVSANIRFHAKPWQKKEYDNWHVLSANWGFLRKTFYLGYIGNLQKVIGKWDVLLKARWDAPAAENFFGVGNESPDPEVPVTFYSTSSRRLFASAGMWRNFGLHHRVEFAPFYQRIKVEEDPNHFIYASNPDPGVFEARQFAGIEAGYKFSTANSLMFPTKGINFELGGGFVQNIRETTRSFVKVQGSLAAYVPLGSAFTLAVRAGGGTLTGQADYYHMNTLGGNENLRGYERERFFGKTSFYNNNEIRWVTGTRNYFFNGKIGLLAFYDQGRVWQPGEKSDKWHAGYGGGLILIPFNKVALVGTYGISPEGGQTLLRASVFF